MAAPAGTGRSSSCTTTCPAYGSRGVCDTTKFSLLRHLEVCLLDLALPAKVYDCRAPSAHKTHPTNSVAMYGLASRLGRHQVSGEASAMEAGFPDRQALRIEGQEVSLTVYAFALGADKIPKARMYRSGDYGTPPYGMAFGLNNQTQARRSWQFFHRKEVGLSLLSNSLPGACRLHGPVTAGARRPVHGQPATESPTPASPRPSSRRSPRR